MSWLSDRLAPGNDILTLPGCHDALSARLVACSGAEAVYCGGFAATASAYALPDLGLLGLSDMLELYGRIAAASKGLPLIVDGDAGHGGLLNVERTVNRMISVGIRAVHIEDQMNPKRCGHLAGKSVVPLDEAVARIRTAVETARNADFGVIARTDALAVEGFDATVKRANAYADAGADAVFVDAPQSQDQIAALPGHISAPLVFSAAATGTSAITTTNHLRSMGYQVVLHPGATLVGAIDGVRSALEKDADSPSHASVSFQEINEILDTDGHIAREARFARSRNTV